MLQILLKSTSGIFSKRVRLWEQILNKGQREKYFHIRDGNSHVESQLINFEPRLKGVERPNRDLQSRLNQVVNDQ